MVVAGYMPTRCFFNTGELWRSADPITRTVPLKCGDRQLLHPAARSDAHFLSLVSLRNQSLDIGNLLTQQGKNTPSAIRSAPSRQPEAY